MINEGVFDGRFEIGAQIEELEQVILSIKETIEMLKKIEPFVPETEDDRWE